MEQAVLQLTNLEARNDDPFIKTLFNFKKSLLANRRYKDGINLMMQHYDTLTPVNVKSLQFDIYQTVNETKIVKFQKLSTSRAPRVVQEVMREVCMYNMSNLFPYSGQICELEGICAWAIKHGTRYGLMYPKAEGTLLDHMNNMMTTNQKIDDVTLQRFAEMLLSAVYFLESNGIHHFDLKLENVVIQSQQLYLIDFGLAHCDDWKLLQDFGSLREGSCIGSLGDHLESTSTAIPRHGTLAYLPAGEIAFEKPHCFQRDKWALAVMIFILAYGEQPYMQPKDDLYNALDAKITTVKDYILESEDPSEDLSRLNEYILREDFAPLGSGYNLKPRSIELVMLMLFTGFDTLHAYACCSRTDHLKGIQSYWEKKTQRTVTALERGLQNIQLTKQLTIYDIDNQKLAEISSEKNVSAHPHPNSNPNPKRRKLDAASTVSM